MTENEYIQGRVQVLLMKEKIKDLKRQQRDMELRFAIREAKEHQRELERRFNHNHDSKGRFASGSNSGLTKSSKSSTIKIGRKEYNKVRKKINSQFYMYSGKKHGHISSAELNARYEFDIIGFDNYIITEKEPL